MSRDDSAYIRPDPDEPVLVSFSGGRSSAFMLWRCLEVHGGTLPACWRVVFTNTGKEMEETLDFVQECGERWGVDIAWLEGDIREATDEEKAAATSRRKFTYGYREVCHSTASRAGEPFSRLISAKNLLPHAKARICTGHLKIMPAHLYMLDEGFDEYVDYLGIRHDEPRRWAALHGTEEKSAPGCFRFCPLHLDGVTQHDVSLFWDRQNFRLNLPFEAGETVGGNCDLCFMKSVGQKVRLIMEDESRADWWIEQERKVSATFRDGYTYEWLRQRARALKGKPAEAEQLLAAENFQLAAGGGCFCGD